MAKRPKKKPSKKPGDQQPAGTSLIPYVSPHDRRAREEADFKARVDAEEKVRYNQKLTRQMQFEVCMMIALGHGDRYIAAHLKANYSKDGEPPFTINWATINEVYRHGKKWQPVIVYLKKKYIRNVSRHIISNRGWRLGVLEKCIMAATESGDINLVAKLMHEAREEMGDAHERGLADPLPPGGIRAGGDVHYHRTNVFQGVTPEAFKELSLADRIRTINDGLSSQRR